jgi:hypothetical protein
MEGRARVGEVTIDSGGDASSSSGGRSTNFRPPRRNNTERDRGQGKKRSRSLAHERFPRVVRRHDDGTARAMKHDQQAHRAG